MLGVPRAVELKIKNTKEGKITIEEIKDYFIRLSLDDISVFFKGVNTLKNIDVSNMPWEVKEIIFDYLSFTLEEKQKLL